jgi:Domain of unknown function (DUF4365)
MPLSDNDVKSELSYAYLHAVAARAGCACEVALRHSNGMGVDARLVIKGDFAPSPALTRFDLAIQLKATSQPLAVVEGRYAFRLAVEEYDKLRDITSESALLLVVLQLPDDPVEWLICSPEALTLKRCAHWVSLFGGPASANTTSQTVYLPQANLFSAEALRQLLIRLARKERIPYA